MGLLTKRFCLSVIVASLCMAFCYATAYAKEVVATGRGPTREKALDDAYRNAVEKALGVFIRSETKVRNYQLIEDHILSIAEGYVRTFDYLHGGCKKGSCYVKINANVDSVAVKKTLIEHHIGIMDGEQIYARLKTKSDAMNDRVKRFKEEFQKWEGNTRKPLEYPKDFVDIKFSYSFRTDIDRKGYAIFMMTRIRIEHKSELMHKLRMWVLEGDYAENKALFNELYRRGYPVKKPESLVKDYSDYYNRVDSSERGSRWTIYLLFLDQKGKVIHKVTQEDRLDNQIIDGRYIIQSGDASGSTEYHGLKFNPTTRSTECWMSCCWPGRRSYPREYHVPMQVIRKAHSIKALLVDENAGSYDPSRLRITPHMTVDVSCGRR